MDFCKPFLHDMLYKKWSKLKSESVAYDLIGDALILFVFKY